MEFVFGQEALDFARGEAHIVPNPVIVAVAVEDHRPLAELLFQAIGIELRERPCFAVETRR